MIHFNFKGHIIIVLIILGILIYKFVIPWITDLRRHSATKELYTSLKDSNLPWEIFGRSTQDRPVYLLELGEGASTTLIFGAFHGNEQSSFHVVVRLADTLYSNPGLINSKVVLIPAVNPDGLMSRSRTNSNGVDVNRNFPTENWTPVYEKKRNHPGPAPGSEIETALVMQMINMYKPDKIITIHQPLEMNNYDGPAAELAELMSEFNGYPVTTDVGYATPGSFGNYAGRELQIPVVTLELPRVGPDKAWDQNFEALVQGINFNAGDGR